MDDDAELEALRQRRMAEMMAQRGGGGAQTEEKQRQAEEQQREQEERRQAMLAQIMSPEARARLARIALVKPDKARGVEDLVIRMAQMGQITEKVSEDRLISLLEQINEQQQSRTRVTIQRRNVFDDDD
jgi:programmed cell death protein 5